MWRCINDLFGYCKDVPDWTQKPTPLKLDTGKGVIETGSVAFGKCRHRYKTCPHYLTQTQLSQTQ